MRVFIYACITLVLCRLMASFVFSTFDDAYITFRYSRNLAEGIGLVYNLNERVLGTTAPLFAVIGSIPAWLKIPVPSFFLWFNICCDLGSLYLIYRFLLGDKKIAFILFALFFSLDPMTNRIAVGGMEANLFLLCSLLGMVLYFRQQKILAFSLLSVIYFLRPEALILFSILLVYDCLATKTLPIKYLGVGFLITAPALFAIHHYYGHVLPQSVIVKNEWRGPGFISLIHDIFFPHFYNYFLFPIAILGMVKSIRRNKYLTICGIWLIVYAGAYCVKGPWMMNWYIYTIVVLQLLFASLAVSEILPLVHPSIPENKLVRASFLMAVGCWLFICFYKGRSGQDVYVFQELKKDLDSGHNTKLKFVADDIGAIGYFSRGYIYDNLMLVTPQAREFPNLRERILHVNPDYLFFYTTARYINMIKDDSILSHNYHFVKRYSRNGETGLPANSDQITGSYHVDYMLWKRNN